MGKSVKKRKRAALVGAIHLIIVLTVSGMTDIIVGNIAIFSAATALMAESLPKTFNDKIMFWQKQENQKDQARAPEIS